MWCAYLNCKWYFLFEKQAFIGLLKVIGTQNVLTLIIMDAKVEMKCVLQWPNE